MKNRNFDNSRWIQYGETAFRLRAYAPIPFYLICLWFAKYDSALFAAGLVFVAGGESLRFYAAGYLGPRLRSVDRARTDDLVIAGPFRIVRNPIYVGNMSIYFGFGVLSNVFFPAFPLVILLFFMTNYRLIVAYEEACLESVFGVKFRDFKLAVPAFLPHLKVSEIKTSHAFSRQKAWQSEKPTMITLVPAFTGLVIKMLYS